MIKKLIIHLGDCKTGSTSIQSILANKSWSHPTKTLIYPAQFNHIPLAKALCKGSKKKVEKLLPKLVKQFDQSDADIGIISAETFEVCDPYLLQSAVQNYLPQYQDSIELIAYIRPHVTRILSSFSERVKKGGFNQGLKEFVDFFLIKEQRALYFERCQNWKSIFGNSYHIYPMMPRHLYQQDVVYDFLYKCFGDDQFSIQGSTRHRESLSVEDLSLLRYIHLQLGQKIGKKTTFQQKLGVHLAEIFSKNYADKSTKLAFSRDLFREVFDLVSEDAQLMDSNFFQNLDSPMQSSLEKSGSNLVDQEQSLDIFDHYDRSSARIVDCWLQYSINMHQSNPRNYVKMSRRPKFV